MLNVLELLYASKNMSKIDIDTNQGERAMTMKHIFILYARIPLGMLQIPEAGDS